MKNLNFTFYLRIKNTIVFLILLFAFTANALAQTPQYYNANSGGIGNSLPFANANGYKTQWLIGPGEFSQPSPAPSGNITKLYIYMSSTGGPATYSNLTIKMAQTTITSFPTGEYTGTLDSVYGRSSVSLSSTANSYLVFTLDAPFNYNPAQSLVIQVYHCGFSGSGMSLWQTAGTTGIIRRNNIPGTTSCVFTYSGQDTRILQCGVDISTALPPVLVYPPNNSIGIPTSPTFIWNKPSGTIINYWWELTTDTVTMANLQRDSTLTDTTKSITGLSNLTTYFWKVKAKSSSGWGNFSGWFKFSTMSQLYYNYMTGANANSFPFGIAAGKMVQWLVLGGEFNQPSPAPVSSITNFSVRIATGYPLAQTTYSSF